MSANNFAVDATAITAATATYLQLPTAENVENIDVDNAAAAENTVRHCWICLMTDVENNSEWLRPCYCFGTTKWVHQSCLGRWIDHRQEGNPSRAVICQQCQAEYIIKFSKVNRFANCLQTIDNIAFRCRPYIAATAIVGLMYWIPAANGMMSIILVVGPKNALSLVTSNPLISITGLPLIHVGLVLTLSIPWEDAILRLIRNRHNIFRSLPLVNRFYQRNEVLEEYTTLPIASANVRAFGNERRNVACCAHILPIMGSAIGRIVFKSLNNILYRTVLGGLVFIVAKGICKIYLKQKEFSREQQRRILDYTEENIRKYNGYNHSMNNNNASEQH